jgi:hypothetical protein
MMGEEKTISREKQRSACFKKVPILNNLPTF